MQGIGEASLALGDSQGALDSLRESLQIFSKLGDLRGQALILAGLCRTYASLGDFDHAFGHGLKGVMLCAQAGLRTEEVEQLIALGKVNLQQGNQERAMACYQDALALAQARRLADLEAHAWCRLSELQGLQGYTDLSISAAHNTLEIVEKLDAPDLAMECHQALAAVYRQAGQEGRALAHFDQTWELRERNQVQEIKRISRYLEAVHQVEMDTARKQVEIALDRVGHLEPRTERLE